MAFKAVSTIQSHNHVMRVSMQYLSKLICFYCPPRPTLFIQYYSAICRPSNHTMGRPGPRFEPGMGDLEAGTRTTKPPHLLLSKLMQLRIKNSKIVYT